MGAPTLLMIPLGLLLAQSHAPPAPRPLSVQIGLFSYRGDGSNGGSATTGGTSGDFEGNLYATNGCSLGAGTRAAPAAAANVWRVSGQIVDMTGDSAVVDLQWSRVKDAGQPSTVSVTQRLSVHANSPVTIDTAVLAAQATCDVSRVALEARLAPRMVADGVGGGRSVGGGGSSFGAIARAGSGAQPLTEETYNVELWLVRQPPGASETSVPVRMRVNSDGGSFTFPAVVVTTVGGQASVTIGGAFRLLGTAGSRQLSFSTSRTVRYERGPDTDRDRLTGAGSSQTTIPMPGPDDVLSFEMPQIQSATGAGNPERFSVRLRIRPIQ